MTSKSIATCLLWLLNGMNEVIKTALEYNQTHF